METQQYILKYINMEKILAFLNELLEKMIMFDYLGFLSNIFSLLTFETFLKLVIIYFFIVWIAIVIWVTKDIINRTNNILYQIFSIFTVLLWTPLGIVVYLLIRPSKTLFEKYYEEASIEEDLELDDFVEKEEMVDKKESSEKHTCLHCSYDIQLDYKFCPNCRACLKKECSACGKEINPKWTICPYCGKDQENKIQTILEIWGGRETQKISDDTRKKYSINESSGEKN